MSRTLPALVVGSFIAGCAPGETQIEYQSATELFAQAANNQVDILWVIDNSNSMVEEQEALAAGFSSFASQLEASQTEFQIGIITTSFDYDDDTRGVLVGEPKWVTNDDDYEAIFAERATAVGVGGSDKEKGLEAALYALSPTMVSPGLGGPNEGFVRPDAQLLIVFVSDEEDCSDGGALEGEAASACYTSKDQLTSAESFVEDFRALKTDETLVSVGAIVGSQASSCPDVVPGTRYLTVAALMGGLLGDICETNWSGMLSDLGLTATGIRSKFQLGQAAQPDSIEITMDDTVDEAIPLVQSETDGWTYNQDTWWIELHGSAIPPRGGSITVKYLVDPAMVEPLTTTGAAQ